MNMTTYFDTISRDKLANIARFIHKPTLLSLLTTPDSAYILRTTRIPYRAEKDSPFYHITPLIFNKLRVRNDRAGELDIEGPTLHIRYHCDLRILCDMVKEFGSFFKTIELDSLDKTINPEFASMLARCVGPKTKLEIRGVDMESENRVTMFGTMNEEESNINSFHYVWNTCIRSLEKYCRKMNWISLSDRSFGIHILSRNRAGTPFLFL